MTEKLKKDSKIQYFLYARKSTESEDRQVQSIEDQVNRLKELAERLNLNIAKTFTEAKSAKQPGNRPVFSDMLERIKNGEANGILCWKIDRLSRNPVDSGTLSWLLQSGVVKSIQTPDREYCPEDNVLIFNVESGMANQFIIDLRKNTIRGLQGKLERGWLPSRAPLGYLNEKESKTILKDPERFTLVRKMWDMVLTGTYTPHKILDIATRDWGFRTPKWKTLGNKELSLSGIYRIFANPFYTGIIEYNKRQYPGKHEPMVTLDEYDRVQVILGRKGRPRPKAHEHAFTGLIECGECGAAITAETKMKHIKSTGEVKSYTYYHCTHRRKNIECSQRGAIKQENLERQIDGELSQLTILPEFRDWALEILNGQNDKEIEERTKVYDMQHKNLAQSQLELDNLTKMRYRELIDDETFIRERDDLQNKIRLMRDRLRETESRADKWLELTEQTFEFAASARKAFASGDLQTKKEILSALGETIVLKDGKLSIKLNEWLKPIKDDYPILEKQYLALEPKKHPMNKAQNEALASLHTLWGG